MSPDIRTAALDAQLERRVRLAVALLGAYRIRTEVAAWKGDRCDLLIAAADTGAGRRSLLQALERGIPVLAIGASAPVDGLAVFADTGTVADLAEAIRVRLAAPTRAPAAVAQRAESAPGVPALCRLAKPPLAGHDIYVRRRSRRLQLCLSSGRVHAPTHSDLLAASDAFADADWELELSRKPPDPEATVSGPLEPFLLRAAWHARERLPAFPQGRYWLATWPDLGPVPALTGTLHLARRLTTTALTAGELVSSQLPGMGPAEVNACLWAFAAAGLLRDHQAAALRLEPAAGAPRPRLRASLWTSLARRMGLMRP